MTRLFAEGSGRDQLDVMSRWHSMTNSLHTAWSVLHLHSGPDTHTHTHTHTEGQREG